MSINLFSSNFLKKFVFFILPIVLESIDDELGTVFKSPMSMALLFLISRIELLRGLDLFDDFL